MSLFHLSVFKRLFRSLFRLGRTFQRPTTRLQRSGNSRLGIELLETRLTPAGSLGTLSALLAPAATTSTVILQETGNWTASNPSNAPWLHLNSSSTSGTGNALIQYSVDANTGATRTGTLNIDGINFSVTQAGSTFQAATALNLVSSNLNDPDGVAVDGSGNVYIADYRTNSIKEYVPSTQTLNTLVSSGLNGPTSVAVDGSGNVYIADYHNSAIDEYVASTQAVKPLVTSGVHYPENVAVDGSGNVYIADAGNNAIKEYVASTQTLKPLVTSGLNFPTGVAVDSLGDVYIADLGNNAIKEYLASTQIVKPLVTSGLNSPQGVAVDGSGNVYIEDTGNNAIKEYVASTQTVTTLLSSGLNSPQALAVDGSGNVFIADSNHNAIQEIPHAFINTAPVVESYSSGSDTLPAVLGNVSLAGSFAPTSDQPWLTITGVNNGVVSFNFSQNKGAQRTADITVLGQTITITQSEAPPSLGTTTLLEGPVAGSDSVLLNNGDLSSATSNSSWITLNGNNQNGSGNSVVSFSFAQNLGDTRQGTLTIDGITLTVTQAGSSYVAANSVSSLVSSVLNNPRGVAVDSSGNVYIADSGNNAIKEWVASTQTVKTLVSSGLSGPSGVAVDASGNVYIADYGTSEIKEWIASTQMVQTLVSGLSNPLGVAVDALGNVYIADYGHSEIKEWIASTQKVQTLVSSGLSYPQGVAVDASGNVYIADTNNQAIKEWVASTQSVKTLVSSGLYYPEGLAVDASGNVYAADTNNQAIKEWVHGFVNPSAITVGPGASTGSSLLSPVLPTSQVLTGVYAPSSSASWLTLGSPVGGQIPLIYSANPTQVPRSATVTVLGQPIVVTQLEAPTLAASTKLESSSAGNDAIALSYVGLSWTASSNASWLHINPDSASGTGSSYVQFSIDQNTGTTRIGTLTIAGLTFTVTQAGSSYVAANPISSLISPVLQYPQGVAVDSSGNVYIADTNNNTIDEWVASTQTVRTLVSYSIFNSNNMRVVGLAVDASGNVYIAEDSYNGNFGIIQEWVVNTQTVQTLVSSGLAGSTGVAVDASGNVYIADTYNQAIKEWVASTQKVQTLVSSGLSYPRGVAVDASGNVYIADTGNREIKEWVVSTQKVLHLVYFGLDNPSGVAVDASGNVYIADTNYQAIEEWVASTQTVQTLVFSGLSNPYGVAVDASGNVYIADTFHSEIKEWVASTQTVQTLVSSGLSNPYGVAVDASGNVYIADTGNREIKEWVASTQTVQTLVSSGLSYPYGVAVDASGNVYIADTGHSEIKEWVASTQTVQILVSGLLYPQGVAVDASGNVYIADTNNQAIKEWVASTQKVQTLVSGLSYPQDVAVDASGNVYIEDINYQAIKEWVASTQTVQTLFFSGLSHPHGVAVDASGNVYIADSNNNEIKEWVASTQKVQTLVSGLSYPQGVAVDASGNVYFADSGNNEIKDWVATTQTVKTLVSSSQLSFPGGVAVDSSGNVYIPDYGHSEIKEWVASTQKIQTLVSSGLSYPRGVAVDASGNVYIADTSNQAIKEWVASTQTVQTLVSSDLNGPYGVAVDASGNVYIADSGNNEIKEWVASTQKVQTLVSGLSNPLGVAVDALGNVYIADYGHSEIKEWIASTQKVQTLVSSGLSYPQGVAVDASGNVYIADTNNQAIKEWVASTQTVKTLVSSGLYYPYGVAVDASGNVTIADTVNREIKELPDAFVNTAPVFESYSSGNDTLPAVLGSVSLTGLFAPTSNQSWLTITGVNNGAISFSLQPNTGGERTASISVLGQTIPVIQRGSAYQSLTVNPVNLTYGTALANSQLSGTATLVSNGSPVNVDGVFTYTTPASTVLQTGSGQLESVTFTPTDTADYPIGTTTATVNVAQATPSLTLNPVNITYGTALTNSQLTGSASYVVNGISVTVPGTFTYTSAAVIVLNAGNAQMESVTFTPVDTIDYTTVSTTATVNVAQATPALTLNPVNITYGTALTNSQLTGSASYVVNGISVTVPGTLTYSSGAGNVLNAGNGQTQSVKFTPTDTIDYTTVSTTVTVNVAQATPALTLNPVNITYGTALVNTQLTGSASYVVNGSSVTVPGTLTYTSAAGNVLNAGNGQTQSVTFTPTDLVDYNSTSANVTVNVSKATLTIAAIPNIKAYDGTTSAAGVPTVSGLKKTDTVSGLVETYASPSPGTGKEIDVTQYVIHDGYNGQNYSVNLVANYTSAIGSLTNPGTQNSAVGDVVSLQLQSAGLPQGISGTYSASGLPSGLIINTTTGVISGTIASGAQTSSVTITGNAGSGVIVSQSFTWNISVLGMINPGTQNSAIGNSISLQIQATGLPSGDKWSYTAGGLPGGLSINAASGLISGTLNGQSQASSVKITASDGQGGSVSQSFTWNVFNAQLTVTSPAQSPSELQNISTGSVLLATYQASGTAIIVPASFFTATVNWKDGVTESSSSSSNISIAVSSTASGTFIQVYGTHTYTGGGQYLPGVILTDPVHASTSATTTTFNVATDYSSQTSSSQGGAIKNSNGTYTSSLTVINNGTTTNNGSLEVVLQGLTSNLSKVLVKIGSTVYDISSLLTQDSKGDWVITIPKADLLNWTKGSSLLFSLTTSSLPSSFTTKTFWNPYV